MIDGPMLFNVNPHRFGTNIFTVNVVDNSTGKATINVGVSLYTTMLIIICTGHKMPSERKTL
jgi:hypothetical protein